MNKEFHYKNRDFNDLVFIEEEDNVFSYSPKEEDGLGTTVGYADEKKTKIVSFDPSGGPYMFVGGIFPPTLDGRILESIEFENNKWIFKTKIQEKRKINL